MAFGISSSEVFVVSHQEDFSYFKTKSSKALVFHETSIQTVEISETFQVNTSGFYAEILSLKSEKENTHPLNYRLLDRRGMLTSQIFPFHFHF
jgi:hypothetical protein